MCVKRLISEISSTELYNITKTLLVYQERGSGIRLPDDMWAEIVDHLADVWFEHGYSDDYYAKVDACVKDYKLPRPGLVFQFDVAIWSQTGRNIERRASYKELVDINGVVAR